MLTDAESDVFFELRRILSSIFLLLISLTGSISNSKLFLEGQLICLLASQKLLFLIEWNTRKLLYFEAFPSARRPLRHPSLNNVVNHTLVSVQIDMKLRLC